MEASLVACEGMWLRKLLSGLFECELEATVVCCDNQSGIRLSENLVFHEWSKHIDIRYDFLRDRVQKGTIQLEYIQTDVQVANIFTKAVCRHSFVNLDTKLRGSVKKWQQGRSSIICMCPCLIEDIKQDVRLIIGFIQSLDLEKVHYVI